jgi:hypothetical protein
MKEVPITGVLTVMLRPGTFSYNILGTVIWEGLALEISLLLIRVMNYGVLPNARYIIAGGILSDQLTFL